MGIATLGLALSANAANVKLGADGGALVFDPATVTIKAGETVTWTNNVGFPHNVVFDEDSIPVRFRPLQISGPLQWKSVWSLTQFCAHRFEPFFNDEAKCTSITDKSPMAAQLQNKSTKFPVLVSV